MPRGISRTMPLDGRRMTGLSRGTTRRNCGTELEGWWYERERMIEEYTARVARGERLFEESPDAETEIGPECDLESTGSV